MRAATFAGYSVIEEPAKEREMTTSHVTVSKTCLPFSKEKEFNRMFISYQGNIQVLSRGGLKCSWHKCAKTRNGLHVVTITTIERSWAQLTTTKEGKRKWILSICEDVAAFWRQATPEMVSSWLCWKHKMNLWVVGMEIVWSRRRFKHFKHRYQESPPPAG